MTFQETEKVIAAMHKVVETFAISPDLQAEEES
jgi:hypothetical protein